MTKITIDRADAVNLARNIVATDSDDITQKGVRILCDAVLRMDAALAQPEQVAGVPDGWKLVPIEPTDEMLTAWMAQRLPTLPDHMACTKIEMWRPAYCAMLSAAPQPPVSEPVKCACGRLVKMTAYGVATNEPAEPQGEQESIKCVVTDNEHPNGIPYEQWVTHPSAAMKPLTEDRLNAAAKKLAALMDYPWEHMPEQGHQTMRKHVIDIIAASRGIGVQQEGE